MNPKGRRIPKISAQACHILYHSWLQSGQRLGCSFPSTMLLYAAVALDEPHSGHVVRSRGMQADMISPISPPPNPTMKAIPAACMKTAVYSAGAVALPPPCGPGAGAVASPITLPMSAPATAQAPASLDRVSFVAKLVLLFCCAVLTPGLSERDSAGGTGLLSSFGFVLVLRSFPLATAGTSRICPHAGHLPRFPAISSAALMPLPHLGHLNLTFHSLLPDVGAHRPSRVRRSSAAASSVGVIRAQFHSFGLGSWQTSPSTTPPQHDGRR